MKTKRFFLIGFLFCLAGGVFYFHPVFAQTINLTPPTLEVAENSDFSLTLEIESVSDLFGLSFDLDFDSSLVSFVSVEEEAFLSPGCQTVLMTDNSSAGKLIVSLTRLGASCDGVSGSGTLMTFNFSSLSQSGINDFSFSNNYLCLLEDASCNYVIGTWLSARVTIGDVTDTTPPTISNIAVSFITSSSATITWTTDEPATSQVEYGLGSSYGQQSGLDSILTTGHSIILENLTPQTTYHFRVLSADGQGNLAAGSEQTFETLAVPDNEILFLEVIGSYQYRFQANLGSYSHIDTNDAYVIGWQDDWDNLIPMTPAAQAGWAEVTLTASGQGVQKFCITNSAQEEWFWIDVVDHPLIIPSIWTDPAAGPDDKVFAFWIDSSDSFQYVEGSLVEETLVLEALGEYQYHLQANLGSYSHIDTNDAYVIGWQDDWDNLIPMTPAAQAGWAEVTLTASGQGVQKFCITNSAKEEWFWIDVIDHPLIIPSIWTDPAAGPDDKVFAFWIDSSDSFQYVEGSLVEETLVLEALGEYQYHLQANLGSYSHIDTNDAYVIGWQDDWDNLIPMTPAAQAGWAEVTLTASGQGVQKFCITNSAQEEWFWIDVIDHPLIIPSIWTDPAAGPDDKVFAFWIDSSDSFQYVEE